MGRWAEMLADFEVTQEDGTPEIIHTINGLAAAQQVAARLFPNDPYIHAGFGTEEDAEGAHTLGTFTLMTWRPRLRRYDALKTPVTLTVRKV